MGPTRSPRAVVLLSGGLDSATALAIARIRGLACHCLTIDYGQRHRHELAAATRIASALGAAEHLTLALDLRAFGGSALTSDTPVPAAGQPGTTIPITYVPARNLIFLSLATALAEVRGVAQVYIGANAVDYSGYPDCRPEFLRSFESTAALATRAGVEGTPLRIVAPLVDWPKARIIQEGVRLGVDFSLTHSCYDPDATGRACGRCDSCVIRRRGFEAAGVPDPTQYALGAP